MKSKSDIVKRILAGISLFIVAFVVIATITMANIDVKYNINCATPNSVEIRVGTNSILPKNPSPEQTNKIVDYINKASKRSVLTNLFNRDLNKQPKIESISPTSSNYRTIGTPNSVNYEYFVIYRYNEPQTLKDGKKNFTDADGNVYLYRDLYFGVKATDGEAEIDVYVVPYYEKGSGSVKNYENNYHYYYVLNADFDGLLNYLEQNWVG